MLYKKNCDFLSFLLFKNNNNTIYSAVELFRIHSQCSKSTWNWLKALILSTEGKKCGQGRDCQAGLCIFLPTDDYKCLCGPGFYGPSCSDFGMSW